MTKKCKILFLLLSVIFLVFTAETSFAQFSEVEPEVKTACEKYPGFINKIVKCITTVVEYEMVEDVLDRVHEVFVIASNAALIIYIMFFGAKLMLGGVEKVKSEVFIVVMTASLVMFMNNTTQIKDVLSLFIKAQSEFANAATQAITTAPIQADGTPSGGEFICVGPYNIQGTYPNSTAVPITDPATGQRMLFSTWQRIDCIVGYLLGVHPLFEKTAQYFEESSNEEDGDKTKQRISYEKFATKDNPFANMAEDPFSFLNDPNKAIKGEGYESFMSFSLVSIIVGMLFSEDMGIIVAITGVFIILLMIAAFGQAVVIYITSMFAIVVLSLFAPIMIPCFLFRPTRRIFDFWLQMFFTYMLQPGIMLAYLSFMLFVMQYVMSYKFDEDGSSTVSSKSLIEFHFSDIYKNADRQGNQVLTSSQDTSSDNMENASALGDGTRRKSNVFNDFADSEQFSILSNPLELANMGRRKTSESNLMNTLMQNMSKSKSSLSMMNNVGIDTPSFKFDTDGPDTDSQKKAFELMETLGYMNVSDFYNAIQTDPFVAQEFSETMSKEESQQFQYAVAYMQLLLIAFLTMSVTFAFMQNVMAFGSEMAGAGTLPVNQMVNVYNSYTTKMASSLK